MPFKHEGYTLLKSCATECRVMYRHVSDAGAHVGASCNGVPAQVRAHTTFATGEFLAGAGLRM